MNQANYSIEITTYSGVLPCSKAIMTELAWSTFQSMKVQTARIAIVFVSEATMQHINESYRFKQGSTDVLSFLYNATDTSVDVVGEVLISLDDVRKGYIKNQYDQEVYRCIIHGVLHLCGMVHPDAEASAMWKLQESILSTYNRKEL